MQKNECLTHDFKRFSGRNRPRLCLRDSHKDSKTAVARMGQRPLAIVKEDVSGKPDRDDRKPALPHSLRIRLFVAPDQPEHPYGQQADEAARAQRVNNACDVRNDAHALGHERHGTQAEKLSHNGQGKQADAKLGQTTNPVPNGTDNVRHDLLYVT